MTNKFTEPKYNHGLSYDITEIIQFSDYDLKTALYISANFLRDTTSLGIVPNYQDIKMPVLRYSGLETTSMVPYSIISYFDESIGSDRWLLKI